MSVLCTELTADLRRIYLSPVNSTQYGFTLFLYLYMYRTDCGLVHYLCLSCLKISLWRCTLSVILSTELTVKVRSIYVSLCTELSVEVRRIYLSSEYRNHSGGALYLLLS